MKLVVVLLLIALVAVTESRRKWGRRWRMGRKIRELKAEIEKLRTEAQESQAAIDAVNTNLAECQTTVDTNADEIQTLNSSLTQCQTTLESKLAQPCHICGQARIGDNVMDILCDAARIKAINVDTADANGCRLDTTPTSWVLNCAT
ncbi:unnamed protein product [Owenia fusiformis]|uniref:Uncharacterized protein n=1 Tax=Owenia fusiformis TaxID=6347 RepID=A0A8J1TLF0_OWEFU|nr:unnamed protein product [Owenia fusiformis]